MGVLVGKEAPDFCAKAVVNGSIVSDFTLKAYRGQPVILFFYPSDFTFVCPTELHAFEEATEKFNERNCRIIACSVDSAFSHWAWLRVPKAKGGIEGITYPLISDLNKSISRDYDVLNETEGVAYRGLFLIDRNGIIRHQVVNDMPLGRSVDEALRMVDALRFFEENGEVCPANWSVGQRGIIPSESGLAAFLAEPSHQA